MARNSIIPIARIDETILVVRGKKVMLDSDLAALYGVTTKALNQAVKRNGHRFPVDFMFQLNEMERNEVVTICDHLQKLKFSPNLPFAFTEHGAVMLASVLNSPRAIEASILVVRAFVRLREVLTAHKEISRKLGELEKRIAGHDQNISAIFDALRRLMQISDSRKRQIGFEKRNKT